MVRGRRGPRRRGVGVAGYDGRGGEGAGICTLTKTEKVGGRMLSKLLDCCVLSQLMFYDGLGGDGGGGLET